MFSRKDFCVANPRATLIESITTLWKGQGNPIRVSMICNPRRGLPSRGCGKSWTREWDSLVPSTMWWLIIFLPRPFQRRFSCTKHSAMAPLPTTTSCYWLRRDVIIYLALNDGAKMLSHPRVRHHRMRQHFPRRAKFGYRSVSSGRNSGLKSEKSLSMSFGCWYLSGIPLCPLHFTVK